MRASKESVVLALAGVAPSLRAVGPPGRRSGCPKPAPRRRCRCPTSRPSSAARKARASVSFGRPNVPEPAAGSEDAPSRARRSHPERRLQPRRRAPAVRPAGRSPIGRSGIYGLDIAPAREITATNRPGQLPEQHVVKKGDTLTSVCELYFGDPWCWPQLWAENPHVTNPHWIFPGDVLRLRAGAAAARRAQRAGSGMRLTSNRKGSLDSKACCCARPASSTSRRCPRAPRSPDRGKRRSCWPPATRPT